MKAALALPLLLRLVAALPILAAVDGASIRAPHSPPATRIKAATALPVLHGGAESLEPIDNRPQTPSSSAIPSVVLAEQKPIETTYLLSLQRKGRKKQTAASAAPVAGQKAGPIHRASAAPQPAERPTSRGHQPITSTTASHPCHRAHPAYRHSVDAAIICLVALFLVVIVQAESRGARDRSSDGSIASDGSEGVIRLEIDLPSKPQPLSIQAEDSIEQAVAEKERTAMRRDNAES